MNDDRDNRIKEEEEEDAILTKARKLAFSEQIAHKNWKVRSLAYERISAMTKFGERDIVLNEQIAVNDDDDDHKWFNRAYFREHMKDFIKKEPNVIALDQCLQMISLVMKAIVHETYLNQAGVDDWERTTLMMMRDFAREQQEKKNIMQELITKAFVSARQNTGVVLAQEIFMLFIEMELKDEAAQVLAENAKHKSPKVAIASIKCVLKALEDFGERDGISKKYAYEAVKNACTHKDEKVRLEGKRVLVELARWIGKDLALEKIKDDVTKQVFQEVEKLVNELDTKAMKPLPTRFPISKKKKSSLSTISTSEVVATDDDEDIHNKNNTFAASGEEADQDPYDFAEPVSILKALEKPSTDDDIPKFWEAVISQDWRHRLHALKALTDACSSSPRILKEDFTELQKCLKKVISKDANANCVAEASKAIEKMCLNARTDFTKDAKCLASALLDKMKDKNAFVTTSIASALDAMVLKCLHSFVDVCEDVVKYGLMHKVGKAKLETLKWLTRSSENISLQEAKKTISSTELLLNAAKLLEDKDPETRKASQEFIATLAGRAGGMKAVAQVLAGVDEKIMKKMTEICAKVVPAAAAETVNNNNNNNNNNNGGNEKVFSTKRKQKDVAPLKSKQQQQQPSEKKIDKHAGAKEEKNEGDLSSQITDSLLRDTADGNWKRRSSALDKLKVILDAAPSEIKVSGLDALFSALRARFTDSNTNLASQALHLAGQFALKCGKKVEKVGKSVLSDCAKHVGDSNRFVREAAFSLISDWGVAVGEAEVLDRFATKFVELVTASSNNNTIICTDGKRETMDFCRETIEAIEKNAKNAVDDVALLLQPAMAFAAIGFKDKSNDVQLAASNLFDVAIKMERSNGTNNSKRVVTREDVLKAIENLPYGLCSAIDARIAKEFPSFDTRAPASIMKLANTRTPMVPASLNIPDNYKNLGTIEEVPTTSQKVNSSTSRLNDSHDNMDIDNLEVLFDKAVKENVSRSSSGDFFEMNMNGDLKRLNIVGGREGAIEENDPPSPPTAPSIWDRALARATADEDDECVEGLKALCHEMNAHAMSDAFKLEISSTIEPLLMFLSDELPIFFENAVKAKKKSNKHKKSKTIKKIEEEREEYETLLRGCKYALMTMHAVVKEPLLVNGASEETTRNVFAAVLAELVLTMDTTSDDTSTQQQSITTILESTDYLNALNALAEKSMENFSKTNSMVSLIKLLSGEGVPDFSQTCLSDNNKNNISHHSSKKNNDQNGEREKIYLFESLVAKCLVKLAFQLEELVDTVNVASIFSAVHEFYTFKGEESIIEGERDDENGNKNVRIVRAVVHEVCKVIGPAAEKYAKLALSGMNVKIPDDVKNSGAQIPSLLRHVQASLKILSGEDEIESKVREELSAIFAKIGDKDTTVEGLEELHDFTQCEEKISRVDVEEHLELTSSAFQAYVKRGLEKVEKRKKAATTAIFSSSSSLGTKQTPSNVSEKENGVGGSSSVFRATPRSFGNTFSSRDMNAAAVVIKDDDNKSPVAKAKSAAEEFRSRMDALSKRTTKLS
jgi:hypothetical protein